MTTILPVEIGSARWLAASTTAAIKTDRSDGCRTRTALLLRVSYVHVARAVYRQTRWVQRRTNCQSTVARVARIAIARDGSDDPACGQFADPVAVCDEQIARPVHCHGARTVQSHAGGRPVITGNRSAAARHGGDNPAWGNLADAVVDGIVVEVNAFVTRPGTCDEQIRLPRPPPRPPDSSSLRTGGWPAVTGEAVRAVACHGGDDSV